MHAKGDKLDHFTIVGEIGRGGMGTIYKALDEMLNRYVALKIIHPQLANDDQLMERFKAEAMTQAQLSHPNIVTVYSFNRIGTEFVMVMEFVEGQSLKEIIQKQKILPVGYAIEIIRSVLAGLTYAHEKQVIHRDVKPANILVGDDGVVKLLDFGIAKIFGSEGLTKTGALIGTPWYCSPEQILGQDMDYRTDIYSAAISFYQMITGRVPFDSENNSEYQIQKAHLETPPPRPTLFNSQINRNLEQIILKGLSKKREKRFRSAQEMGDALRAVEGAYPRERVAVCAPAGNGGLNKKGPNLYLWFWVLIPLALVLFYLLLNRQAAPEGPMSIPPSTSSALALDPAPVQTETVPDVKQEPPRDSVPDAANAEQKMFQSPTMADGQEDPAPPKAASEKVVEKKPLSAEPKETSVALPKNETKTRGELEHRIRVEKDLLQIRRLLHARRLNMAERTVDRLLKGSQMPQVLCLAGTVKCLAGHYDEGESLWKKGLAAGGEIRLAVDHAHGFVARGCTGVLVIRSNMILFDSSSKKEHSFAIIMKELISAVSNGNQLVMAWKDKSRKAQRDFFTVEWSQSETDYDRLASFVTRLAKEE